MNEKRFRIRGGTVSTNYPSGKIFDNQKQGSLYLDEVVDLLNEQESTIKQLQGKVKRLNAFLVEKNLAMEYIRWQKGDV